MPLCKLSKCTEATDVIEEVDSGDLVVMSRSGNNRQTQIINHLREDKVFSMEVKGKDGYKISLGYNTVVSEGRNRIILDPNTFIRIIANPEDCDMFRRFMLPAIRSWSDSQSPKLELMFPPGAKWAFEEDRVQTGAKPEELLSGALRKEKET